MCWRGRLRPPRVGMHAMCSGIWHASHRSSVVMASCVSASEPMASMRWKGKNCFRRSTALWCWRKIS